MQVNANSKPIFDASIFLCNFNAGRLQVADTACRAFAPEQITQNLLRPYQANRQKKINIGETWAVKDRDYEIMMHVHISHGLNEGDTVKIN